MNQKQDRDASIELQGRRRESSESFKDAEPGPSATRPPSILTTESQSPSHGENEPIEPLHATSLPPMDRGFDAWAYLVSAWAVELLVWSYPFSYGVFLNHYATHEFSHVSSTVLSLVGSTSTGLMYLLSLILLPLMNRYPYHKKNMMYLGLVLCMAGLVGAAFAREVWQLILTQGVIFAVGGSTLYFTVTTYLWEWFSEKKGLAAGLIFSGTGVGGVVVPLVVQALLDRYGARTTLLALGISFVVIIPAFPFIKSRTPVSQVVGPRQINTQFLKYNPFWILFASNILQGLGTFLPTLYMPTFASDLNLNNGGTIALSLMNGASAPGLIFLGYISDRLDLRAAILFSTLGSALSVLLIWGFASSLPPLLVFACIYGFLAPSWSALWPRFVFVARGSPAGGEDPAESATLMSIFVAGRGIGNVLSAPIASGLLRPWAGTGKTSFPYGVEGYGPLILFTGIMLLTSTVGTAYNSFERPSLRRLPRRFRRASISCP